MPSRIFCVYIRASLIEAVYASAVSELQNKDGTTCPMN